MDLVAFQNQHPSPFVYVHYPLCRHTCSYCDFNVYPEAATKASTPDFEDLWLKGIERDLATLAGSKGPRVALQSLYLGGGTPSLISEKGLLGLVKILERVYEIAPQSLREFTVECNPESLSDERVRLLKDLGVTRPSLGVQTFEPQQLKRLERLSTHEHIENSLEWISKYFKNYSVDLMIGVPDQTLESLARDLKKIESLRPPHLSVYILTLQPDHIFRTHSAIKKITPDDGLASEMYLMVCEFLSKLNYEHYEVSNFSQPGMRSVHNSNYWNISSSYFGLGPGAHGFLKSTSGERLRYEMIRDPKIWRDDHRGFGNLDELTPDQTKLESFYLDLRTRKPINAGSQKAVFQALADEGLLVSRDGETFVATDRGWLVMEGLAERLIAA